jgi:hypothetical protein
MRGLHNIMTAKTKRRPVVTGGAEEGINSALIPPPLPQVDATAQVTPRREAAP